MAENHLTVIPAYARFNWYWQPQDWLENLSVADINKATEKVLGLQQKTEHLLHQADEQKHQASVRFRNREQLIDSIKK